MAETQDRAYRALFSFPRMVADLVRIFVDGDWVERLDFATLEKVSERDVGSKLDRREKDLLWRIRFRSPRSRSGAHDWFYVYLQIEFQSRPYRFMALRTLVYKVLLYQDLLRRKELTSSRKLPPVLTVVLYTGDRPWKTPTSLDQLMETLPGAPEGFDLLSFRLLDARRVDAELLKSTASPVTELFRLEQIEETTEISQIAQTLLSLLQEDDGELREAFTVFVDRVILDRLIPEGEERPHINDLKEAPTMIAQKIERWTHQWKQEGRAEGLAKGKAEGRREGEVRVLLRLLVKKFGTLPSDLPNRVQRADLELLQLWLDRILTADTLEEVFTD